MNEWCIYIALYCVLLYTQSTLQSYGGVSPQPPPVNLIWTLCQYVINRTRHKFTVEDLSRHTASSVDSIADYNGFYSILLRHIAPLVSDVDTMSGSKLHYWCKMTATIHEMCWLHFSMVEGRHIVHLFLQPVLRTTESKATCLETSQNTLATPNNLNSIATH